MRIDMDTYKEFQRPFYVIDEQRLRSNLSLIKSIADNTGIDIILAFKAYALWKTFPIFREYINATTASSLYEAKLALNEFGSRAHTFSPAYTDYEIDDIARCSSHITFNSLEQYNRFYKRVKSIDNDISCGIRINPEYSEVGTMLYNPCAPGTRFGVTADKLPDILPKGTDGFHCHCHCESGADVFQRTLVHIEEKFSKWFPYIKWINFGGGHLMTHKDYDRKLLTEILMNFRKRYPHLKVILEPGSAFAWHTGELVAQVIDIVEDKGINTAIVNVSFTCHMPDCLEMPYMPAIRGAEEFIDNETKNHGYIYRIGGNSCLSGDFMGNWTFPHPLNIGDNIIFEDMLHYTTVKTSMFNGITHPSIAIVKCNGEMEILREYRYEDYRDRMD